MSLESTRSDLPNKREMAAFWVLFHEVYNLEDALVVAGFLMSFIRHADSVKIANLAQLVNVIAPILTRGDECLQQSIYHAFRLFSTRKGGW